MRFLKWVREHIYYKQINWELLLFLVLFLDVKLWVKALSILLTLFLNRKKIFSISPLQNRLLYFYLLIILTGITNIVIHAGSITTNYLVAASVGFLFWMLAAFASFQCYLFVEKEKPAVIHNTITLFFLLNVLVSCGTLLRIIIETGAINPYTYQGMYQKYFITTGDYLRGITFDTSTTNAYLNTFAIVYFINRKKALFAIICMAGLLLTGSNLTNMLLTIVLAYVFLFQSNRDQKSLVVIWLVCLVVFMVRVSPQNNIYVQETFTRILKKKDSIPAIPTYAVLPPKADSLLTPEERKQKSVRMYLDSMASVTLQKEQMFAQKHPLAVETSHNLPQPIAVKPSLPKDNIHSVPFQRKREETSLQKELIAYVKKDKAEDSVISLNKNGKHVPGKIIAFKQTLDLFKKNPWKIITGTGMGNFSSKLAFRTTSLNIAGGYPSKFTYINNDFRVNHLALFLYYFSNDAQYHSVMNTPNSLYDQLLSEYGIVGLLIFFIFYIGYFVRNIKFLTYGVPVLMVMMGAFLVDYWFEQLSITIIFELLLLLNIRENKSGLHAE